MSLIVTQDLDGHPVTVWVHVINGSKPGPTLGLFSGQIGEKWFVLQFLPRLVAELNPNEMDGTLLVVPVCNPLTLLSEGRVTQNHAAVNDLNQCYPGIGEWIVEQIAHKIASEIVPKCTAILDFHEGNLFSLCTVAYAIDYPDQSLGE